MDLGTPHVVDALRPCSTAPQCVAPATLPAPPPDIKDLRCTQQHKTHNKDGKENRLKHSLYVIHSHVYHYTHPPWVTIIGAFNQTTYAQSSYNIETQIIATS
jgi:hypothetical protein